MSQINFLDFKNAYNLGLLFIRLNLSNKESYKWRVFIESYINLKYRSLDSLELD